MDKCGECIDIDRCEKYCGIKKTDDTHGCTMFYPDIYSEVSDPEGWEKYRKSLYEKDKE